MPTRNVPIQGGDDGDEILNLTITKATEDAIDRIIRNGPEHLKGPLGRIMKDIKRRVRPRP